MASRAPHHRKPLVIAGWVVAACCTLAAHARAQGTAAAALASGHVLLDMGPLADSEGKGGRLWVEAAALSPNACHPKALHVLVDVHTPLGAESVARQWLQAAHHQWQRACPGPVARSVGLVRLALYQGFELAADANGNLPEATVRATASLQGKELLFQQYSNNATSLQRQNASLPEQRKEYSANAARLKALLRQYEAKRVLDLQTLDKHLAQWQGKVVVLGVRPERVLSRKAATVRAAHREGWDVTEAVAEGAEIAKWGKDSRVIAARVKGRSTDVRTQDRVIVQVLGSQTCAELDCEDYLLMPGGQWAHDRALP